MQPKTDVANLAHKEITTMKKKKRRAAIAVVAWRRKATKVNTARAMLANKQSAAARQNLCKFCEGLTANRFVPKNLLDAVMVHSSVTLKFSNSNLHHVVLDIRAYNHSSRG